MAAVANAGASHQMAMCAIGRELQRRGHEFVLFGTEFQRRQLRVPNVAFETVGEDKEDPVEVYLRCAHDRGTVPISASIEYMKGMAELLCSELPSRLRAFGIDLVLADQEEPGAATASDLCGLPYASICNSLPLNADPNLPPGFMPWHFSTSPFAKGRNRLGYAVRNRVVGRVHGVLNRYRRAAGLRRYVRPDDSFSTQVQITQLVKELDFPRAHSGTNLRYVGPFQKQPLFAVEFPYHRLNGAPIVYASFGTSFGTRSEELRQIASACASLPVQLIISLGGAKQEHKHHEFPGKPIIVSYAPQRELLSRAAVTVTHGGLNTTMEALGLGVPLLAIPLAGDQFGVAARIHWHSVGRTLQARHLKSEDVRLALASLLEDGETRAACRRMADAIGRTGGAAQAAEIVEALIR